jgi:two-component system chemotaxis response regulator CheB
VVDDSVVVRQLVARVLDAAPSTELAGVAANGRVALEKIARLHPDVVILDLEMPEMDGLETLAAIRRTDRSLPVIVYSYLTAAGAAASMDAFALGATDIALKPTADGIGMAAEQVRDELIPRIDGLRPAIPRRYEAEQRRPARAPRRVSAVTIAASTGGPNALAVVLASLPANLAVPVFVVQHMPPLFTALLAERLDRLAPVSVTEATDGEVVVPGRVYVAPGGRHLSIRRARGIVRMVLTDDPPENSCRPAADVLFRTAAAVYGPETLAIVLTGMGHDGRRGAEAVHAAGGYVVAQSASSSVVASMPAAVTEAGLADAVVPLEEMPTEVVRWFRSRAHPHG